MTTLGFGWSTCLPPALGPLPLGKVKLKEEIVLCYILTLEQNWILAILCYRL